ncbi:hypothetical protein MTBBW1_1880006 [Desulfamplus magnetovallimortis]|uniref:Uncharacterized protein n=1 Tax=Desulfamplus magnetovallimortis TaxID=1246637 RepID=A0A1W1HAV9_9BACT|nr:hypothetical protein [Desulfamplus magnetovallimortis]SLM29569.1 hypothetical protein MTBBW1_1880006 [Desulfamplus magnetovallimortis]
MAKSKETETKLKAIRLALQIKNKTKEMGIEEHRSILEATGMDAKMVQSTLDSWEMEPKGLMWYHSREWLRRVERQLQEGF